MSDAPEGERVVKVKVKSLKCRRTGQMYTVAQHVQCPYCYGDEKTIEAGQEYDRFCEFQKGKDPIHFGFPEDSSRTQSG